MVEVDVELKRRLYLALELAGLTLKDWFQNAAAEYCDDIQQPSLFRSRPADPPRPSEQPQDPQSVSLNDQNR